MDYSTFLQAKGPRLLGNLKAKKLAAIKRQENPPPKESNQSQTPLSQLTKENSPIQPAKEFYCTECKLSKVPVRGFFWKNTASVGYIWSDFDQIQGQDHTKNRLLIHKLINKIHNLEENPELRENFPIKCCFHLAKQTVLQQQNVNTMICFGEEALSIFLTSFSKTQDLGKEIFVNSQRFIYTYHPNKIRNGTKELIHTVWSQHLKKGNLL